MQSELYTDAGADKSYGELKNQGLLAFDGTNGNLEEPTFVVWNGRPESTTGERAIGMFGGDSIKTGDTIRIFAGNIGPNFISSFHAIGEIFDTVYVEGSFALENHWVQSTLIPAGGAVGVEFTVEVPGDYTLVDHAIYRIHKGAVAATPRHRRRSAGHLPVGHLQQGARGQQRSLRGVTGRRKARF